MVVPFAIVKVWLVQPEERLMVTGEAKLYPEASMLVLTVARLPSRVSVILAGYVDVGLIMKLPLTVKVGLEAKVRVAALLLVTLPMPLALYVLKSGADTLGKLNVPELSKLPLNERAVAVPEMLPLAEFVNVPEILKVPVPVPTVMVPLFVRL